ncbi:DUF2513 domain-containing protein [Vibrio parahaemolyticus]|uniref:DUF2513 domain-containing protein n=2 Tax=Vibrio parahaemolyticus TaxID=670 RepID=UPI00038E5EC6|nr:DUF2513 domain-containing protein [Vibrio parahaemolyticus]EQM39223.1 hypothetical protein D042_1273 [Vibrio parahaemolyticus NIHCB0757]EGR0923717.1 DUF2513 domain-containing protein [Vibrio parahaemolyticus]EGR1949034.1 DUF2513 domain-containing protein [Vibrio parahaemolyticus]EIN9987018.1 DUF2513 domain-containing protein [Vibrio parahaemolyticus]EJU8948883.1 DUF2513 domain-containing protein [Vibrio parahaemolyticus]
MMKRDMELIRKLLLTIEENPRQLEVEGYDKNQVKYHALLLIEAGFLDGNVSDTLANTSVVPTFVSVNRLTWDGHEFLDNIRKEEVWNTIKTEFKDASISTVFSIGKQLTENYAKKKLSSLLGE